MFIEIGCLLHDIPSYLFSHLLTQAAAMVACTEIQNPSTRLQARPPIPSPIPETGSPPQGLTLGSAGPLEAPHLRNGSCRCQDVAQPPPCISVLLVCQRCSLALLCLCLDSVSRNRAGDSSHISVALTAVSKQAQAAGTMPFVRLKASPSPE